MLPAAKGYFPMLWQADPWRNSFLKFFQVDKSGNPKSIVKISLQDWQT
jgi:hypothetical protein